MFHIIKQRIHNTTEIKLDLATLEKNCALLQLPVDATRINNLLDNLLRVAHWKGKTDFVVKRAAYSILRKLHELRKLAILNDELELYKTTIETSYSEIKQDELHIEDSLVAALLVAKNIGHYLLDRFPDCRPSNNTYLILYHISFVQAI